MAPSDSTLRPLWIYLHLSKCAGSTVRTMLQHNLSPRQCLSLGSREVKRFRGRPKHEMVESILGGDREHIQVVHGHGTYLGIHEHFPNRTPRYVVFVRHPVRRVVSNYRYRLRQRDARLDDGQPSAAIRERSHDFGDIDDFERWLERNDQSRNFMTRSLYRRTVEVGPEVESRHEHTMPLPDDALERVVQALANLYFVGVVEHPNDFAFLYGALGFRWSTPREKVSTAALPSQTARLANELVERLNPVDMALYAAALDLNARFRERGGDYGDAVHRWQRWQRWLSPFQGVVYRTARYANQRSRRFNRLHTLGLGLKPDRQ